jgi:hypothetical protein
MTAHQSCRVSDLIGVIAESAVQVVLEFAAASHSCREPSFSKLRRKPATVPSTRRNHSVQPHQ